MEKRLFKKSSRTVAGILFALSILLVSAPGCHTSTSSSETVLGDWISFSDFDGVPRSSAVVFVIGNKAYVGTGYDGKDRLKDFWEYDQQTNNWKRKADFPGAARNGAVGLSVNSKGYIGTGYDGTNRTKDFYQYDPATDTWTQISDFGGTARYGAVAFGIGDKGYVATGDDGNFLKDLWEYDPSTNRWTQKVSMSGAKRRGAVALVIDGKAYVCTGVNNGAYENDLWQYDPANDQWNKKRSIANVSDEAYDDSYADIIGVNKVAFSINGKGYVATGGQSSLGTSAWEYDPVSDSWNKKTSFEGSARTEAVGFSIGNYGYVATGRNASYYFDDLWGFKPDDEQQSNN
jgi:N-acetylneuraminic acid mutarotase